MKIFTVSLILLFSGLTMYAQVADGLDQQINLNEIGREGNTGVVRTFDHRYEGVKGSPFFVDQWITGTVYLENGKIYKNVPLKYDVYQNELLAKTRGQAIYITRDIINNFVLKPDSLSYQIKFTKVTPENKVKRIDPEQFLQVLYEGDLTLLELKNKVFIKANYQGAYSANQPFDEFKDTSKFYYLDQDGNLNKLKTSIGGVAKIFGDKKKQVKDFIFEQELNPKNKTDLIKIFEKGLYLQ